MIRQFMVDGLIPHGDVDTRSILEVTPNDLKPYTQCHFFAGIAGWTFALQRAQWPADRPVWTGSCPCQPFSSAGRQKGKEDERHLLPAWLNLVRQCRPASLYGEQVASAIAHGWLDDVYQGLEAEGYAVGAAILPACSVGAPHKRDRLWFVAHTAIPRPLSRPHTGIHRGEESAGTWHGEPERCGAAGSDMADATDTGLSQWGEPQVVRPQPQPEPQRCSGDGDVGNSQGDGRGQEHSDARGSGEGNGQGKGAGFTDNGDGPLADTERRRPSGPGTLGQPLHPTPSEDGQANRADHAGSGMYANAQWLLCPDQKYRLIEPSISLLAHGVQFRRPILYGTGNAIHPEVGAEFIKATM